MVSVCTVPARGGRLCEVFGGYKAEYLYIYIYTETEAGPVLSVFSTDRWTQ